MALVLPKTLAQTATPRLSSTLPASCTALATLLSESPPPTDGKVVDNALNNAISEYVSTDLITATGNGGYIDPTSFCDFVISTQIPSATPSATSSLSSYISAAGIWLDEYGFAEASSVLEGDCLGAVGINDGWALTALNFVVGFGPCYTLLGWDKRTSAGSGSATMSGASSATSTPSETGSAQITPSPTGQATETNSPPPNAGNKKVADPAWILGATLCVALLLWR
ncbi:hypothetical protein RRF57_004655 [Xylaria bambusicola]|uniref:Uncharacterized protein n=1 Tax=Xylaria bambusicola TaxID=326684 RepID=A0AAN7YX69_9PEZI